MTKRRWGWLLGACFLGILACMILAVSSIVFASSTNKALYRYPGCDSYRVSVWFYRDAADEFYPQHHSMSQKDRTEFQGNCIQVTLFKATDDSTPSGPRT